MADAKQDVLSLDALGLLYLLTHYVEPDYHGSVLTHLTDLTTDGPRAIRSALRKLEHGGWVTLTRERGLGGRLEPIIITVTNEDAEDIRAARAAQADPGPDIPAGRCPCQVTQAGIRTP